MSDPLDLKCIKCGKEKRLHNYYTVNKASTKDLTKNEDIVGDKLAICKSCLKSEYKINDTEMAKKFFEELDYPFAENMWQFYIRGKIEDGYPANFKNIFGTILSTLTMEKPTFDMSAEFEEKYKRKLKDQETQAVNSIRYEALRNDYEISKRKQKKVVEKAIQKKREDLEREIFLREREKYDVRPEDLSKSDISYLKNRWGDDYTSKELIGLERNYVSLIKNSDPNDPIKADIVKKISKISMLMDKALDSGDGRDWKDLGNLYDKLVKTADLSVKKETTDTIDSISEIVAICESTGFIQLDEHIMYDQDKVDLTINNMQKYTRDLVISETGLTKIIKNTLEEMVSNDMITIAELIDIIRKDGDEDYLEKMVRMVSGQGD